MTKEKLKPIFPVEAFKKVLTYPPQKYYQHLCDNLVKYKMMSKKEVKEWDKKLKHLSPLMRSSVFDTVVKTIWESTAQKNYFIKNNIEANKENSVSQKLIKCNQKNSK